MTEIATKFVSWDIPQLDTLNDSTAYKMRVKVINGEKLNRNEKNWITRQVNENGRFACAIPLMGWRFDFSSVLSTYIVKQYGQWHEYRAIDKTALRHCIHGRIERIVKV